MQYSRKVIIILCILALLSAVVVFTYRKYSPADSRLFPQCPFKLLTGWSCPSCGVQRAIHTLLHGRWSEALSYNYFFVISIPYAIFVSIAFILRKTKKSERMAELLEHKTLAMAYVYCFFAWFIIRNVFGI